MYVEAAETGLNR